MWTAATTRSAPIRSGHCWRRCGCRQRPMADLRRQPVRASQSSPHCRAAVTARAQASIPMRLGQPRPAWATLLREDGSLERFQAAGRRRRAAAAADRPASPAERGPARTVLPPDGRPEGLLSAADAISRRAPLRHCRASVCPAHRSGDQGIGDFTTLARFAVEAAQYGRLRWSGSIRCTRCSRTTAAGPARINPRTGASWIRSISTSPVSPAALGFPRRRGPVDYPAVWERKRAILDAAFTAPRIRTRCPDALLPFRDFRDDQPRF